MTSLTYWYPMNGWQPGDGPANQSNIEDAAERFSTMDASNLVIGIDGRKLSFQWDYLSDFDARSFRDDLEQTLDVLFASGYAGKVEFMPINGHYNWQTENLSRSFWMVNATLAFVEDSAHRDKVAGLVTDTEFAPTNEWKNADNLGKAEILKQYSTLLKGVNDRVKAFDDTLTTTTYHGAFIDKGDDRYMLDGVNYGNSAVLGAHVDKIIVPIRLTDAIDPDVAHDFDALIARAVSQSADELNNLAGTATRIILDFEWEEAHRDLGAPNYFNQVEAAIARTVLDHPNFAGFAVFIDPTLSTVELRNLRIDGLASDDFLKGTVGNDTIFGHRGGDTIESGMGDDILYGGPGNDDISTQGGHSQIFGGSGNDIIHAADDSMSGTLGNDELRGGNGHDTILGGLGNDTLRGGAGADRLDGEAGRDIADYSVATRALVLNLADQTLNAGAAQGDILTSLEVIRGTMHDDFVIGDGSRNILRGTKGNDTLNGADGKDRIIGGYGNDVVIGGTGNDRMSGNRGADSFVFRFGDGTDRISDFFAADDSLRFLTGTEITVANDGTKTQVDYGSDSVVLEGVALMQADITFEFF
jgi:Ca2+-binding RTX toxin-like protein